MGLSGVWNLLMALLASCRGTEGDFLRRLHSLSEVGNEWDVIFSFSVYY